MALKKEDIVLWHTHTGTKTIIDKAKKLQQYNTKLAHLLYVAKYTTVLNNTAVYNEINLCKNKCKELAEKIKAYCDKY